MWTGPVPLKCFSCPVPPWKYCLFPLQASVHFRSRTKSRLNTMIKPQILWRRPFFLLDFIPESVGMNRDPHHKIPSWPPPARRGSCPRAKIVPQNQEIGPEPCCAIWNEDFFWSSPSNLRVKLFYALQILFMPLLPRSRYSGATPGREIDQSCMSITRRQNIYLKTPRISIEKHVKTACWQLSTFVPIKSRKNTVLIRVNHILL